MTFSEQLINLRKQKGLSQEQLGAQIGVTRQTVSKWELGDTTPELDKLIQLCDFFHISMDELVGRETTREEQDWYMGEYSAYKYRDRDLWHYEYRSKRSIWGIPLVHINIGRGFYKARGIIAIGCRARGMVALGGAAQGMIAVGGASVGLASVGAASVGLLLAIGGVSVGAIAIGGLAVGGLAIGGCAVGVYAIGGCAVGARVAAGAYANGPIAIGEQTVGEIVFDIRRSIAPDAIKQAILEKYPGTWKWLAALFDMVQ